MAACTCTRLGCATRTGRREDQGSRECPRDDRPLPGARMADPSAASGKRVHTQRRRQAPVNQLPFVVASREQLRSDCDDGVSAWRARRRGSGGGRGSRETRTWHRRGHLASLGLSASDTTRRTAATEPWQVVPLGGISLGLGAVSAQRVHIRDRRYAAPSSTTFRLTAIRVCRVRVVAPDTAPTGGPNWASLKPTCALGRFEYVSHEAVSHVTWQVAVDRPGSWTADCLLRLSGATAVQGMGWPRRSATCLQRGGPGCRRWRS